MKGPAGSVRVLLVDDDEPFRRVTAGELAGRGYGVVTADCGRTALELAPGSEAEVVLLDMRLPDMDGIEVLERLCRMDLGAGVVVLTGHGTIDTAIKAIRLGAYDYLAKPCPFEELEVSIQKASEHVRLMARKRVLLSGYSPPDVRQGMVGASPAFARLLETVARVAAVDSTTLVLGETGVGKELVAKLLHRESARRDAPFVVVNCAALQEELLHSELFGHEKGAFSGAARLKHGLFEVAHGGTLFLDEVGDTSLEIQAKLLRVLESGRFRRLGGTREIAVDVRFVSATNRNLAEAIAQGRFREDLFFRLSTLTIEVPPLRERPGDIALLVAHFSERIGRRAAKRARFDDAALSILVEYPWPGNVRELIHVVEQAIVLADGELIGPRDLPSAIRAVSAAGGPPAHVAGLQPLHEVERSHVLAVLERVGGNRAAAARILDISERNLYRLIRRYSGRAGELGPSA